MDTFTLSAPMAPDPEVIETSFYGNLVAGLGRISGGMLADGMKLDMADDSLSLMCLQSMATEAGLDLIVVGCAPSVDQDKSYVAMSDGSIWRVESTVESGRLVTVGDKPNAETVAADCSVSEPYSAALRAAAVRAIIESGENDPGIGINGTLATSVYAAICKRLAGSGRLLVRDKDGMLKSGYEIKLEAPPRVDLETAVSLVTLRRLELAEIVEEEEVYKNLLGVSSPFPVKIGQA